MAPYFLYSKSLNFERNKHSVKMAKIKSISPVPIGGCDCGNSVSSTQSDWYIDKNSGQWMYKGKPIGVDAIGVPGPEGPPGESNAPQSGTELFDEI